MIGATKAGRCWRRSGADWYDQRSNPAIAVDGGAILAALKGVYHADALLKELGR